MSSWPEAERIFARAKDPSAPLVLDVVDDAGDRLATLRPLIATDAGNDGLVRDIARWREANKERFLTIFPLDVEATRQWIRRFPVEDPRRILFLVQGANGERYGHYGLLIDGPGEIEIDNTLRGADRCPPRLFHHVARRIIAWAIDEVGATRLIVRVLSNNRQAIEHQRANGFVLETILPLREVREGAMVRREVVADPSQSNLPFGLAVLSYPVPGDCATR
ncbi:MAG: GNAT family N-acetyltransferase [Pseudomonadota bacterium]